jgi:hypothetical protein
MRSVGFTAKKVQAKAVESWNLAGYGLLTLKVTALRFVETLVTNYHSKRHKIGHKDRKGN